MEKIKELYKKWYNATFFRSTGLHADPTWTELENYVKEHPDEGKEFLVWILKEEPDHCVCLAEHVDENCKKFFEDNKDNYIPLQYVCSIVLNILEGIEVEGEDILRYRYEEYDAYHEYMKDHYVPWNPCSESDPNITFEEFKQGKRNENK